MAIYAFTRDLVQALTNRTVPGGIRSERHLEEKFVVPAAVRVAASYPSVLLYTHPWGKKDHCRPACAMIPPRQEGWIVGCRKCWADSKVWASVAAFGTHHTFDLAARDHSRTLAVEVKLLRERNGRMPNGELQRFLGQCSLAATRHHVVVGMCGYRGVVNAEWQREPRRVATWFRSRRVHLLFRSVE